MLRDPAAPHRAAPRSSHAARPHSPSCTQPSRGEGVIPPACPRRRVPSFAQAHPSASCLSSLVCNSPPCLDPAHLSPPPCCVRPSPARFSPSCTGPDPACTLSPAVLFSYPPHSPGPIRHLPSAQLRDRKEEEARHTRPTRNRVGGRSGARACIPGQGLSTGAHHAAVNPRSGLYRHPFVCGRGRPGAWRDRSGAGQGWWEVWPGPAHP